MKYNLQKALLILIALSASLFLLLLLMLRFNYYFRLLTQLTNKRESLVCDKTEPSMNTDNSL